MTAKQRYVQAMEWLYIACVWISGVALIVITLVIPYGVFMRYAMNSPSSWPEPFAVVMMVMFSFIGGAAVYRAGAHIAIRALVDNVGPRLRKVLEWATEACLIFFCLFMVWKGFELVVATWYSSIAEFPGLSVGLVYMPIPICGVLLLLFIFDGGVGTVGGSVYDDGGLDTEHVNNKLVRTDNGDGTVSGMNGVDEIFTISVSDNGVVTFAYTDADPVNIWHDQTPANDGDNAEVLQTAVAGKLLVTQTITDADGDTVTSAGLDIGTGGFFSIDDDGPKVAVPDAALLSTVVPATLDESVEDTVGAVEDDGVDDGVKTPFSRLPITTVYLPGGTTARPTAPPPPPPPPPPLPTKKNFPSGSYEKQLPTAIDGTSNFVKPKRV